MYRILEIPWVYRLAQRVLAPGADQVFTEQLRSIAGSLPLGKRILEVGCGPSSYLWRLGLCPVGLDISASYTKNFVSSGGQAVTGSAQKLPFDPSSFDCIWCIGLLHHLPDEIAKDSIQEMMRVCRPEGYIVIVDAVYPTDALRRPMAWVIRKLDRGRHMRQQGELKSLLHNYAPWTFQRRTYSSTGLESLSCIYQRRHEF